MSDRVVQRAGVVAAVAGLAVSVYLTVVHYADVAPICTVSKGCEVVQASEWASVAGVPVALLGAIGYAVLLTLLLLPGQAPRLAAAGVALTGVLFSGWLTYLEIAEIHAICQWCVTSAVLMVALLAVTWRRALA